MIDVKPVRSVTPPPTCSACLTLLTVLACGPVDWQGWYLRRGRLATAGAPACCSVNSALTEAVYFSSFGLKMNSLCLELVRVSSVLPHVPGYPTQCFLWPDAYMVSEHLCL